MPFLNLNYQFLIHEDQTVGNPTIKMPDITKSFQGVVVENDKSDRITLYPGDSKSIVATSRALSWTSSTQLTFERFLTGSDNIRIKWTGTGPNPVFRTARAIGGDATTQVGITRVTAYVARISNVAGTAWTLGTVQNGDLLRLEATTDTFTSPFSDANKGKTWKVQNVGASYIDFIDNGEAALDAPIVLGASFGMALRVFSPGPIKVGDTISVSGGTINPSNFGKFTIADVSSDYLEITNPFGVAETLLKGSASLVIYEYLIGFVHLRASGALKVRFDSQVEWAQLARIGAEAVLISSACTYSVEAYNDGLEAVVVSVQHAAVL